MKSLTRILIACLTIASSSFASAYNFDKRTTIDGVQYGFHQGDKLSPLLIIITTDIKESMTDVYSSVGGTLAGNGYNIASIDVTCHGDDLKKNEKYGLDCWRSRADASSENIFDEYIRNLESMITDISKNELTKSSDIVTLGVSRGGYLAFMAASKIPRISTIIALAPVTDIFRLREFQDSKASRSTYSLTKSYPEIAKKHIFIQINNHDDRVGTESTFALISGVAGFGGVKGVDLSAIVTPQNNHSTSGHDTAAVWAQKVRMASSSGEDMPPPK